MFLLQTSPLHHTILGFFPAEQMQANLRDLARQSVQDASRCETLRRCLEDHPI